MTSKSDTAQAALEKLEQEAHQGCAQAQYALSELRFERGKKAEALIWLKKAVLSRLPDACYTMAIFQMAGTSVPYDASGARINLVKAANQGHAGARLLLSQVARSGYGGARDEKLANRLLLELARKNYPPALCGLAMLFHMRGEMSDAIPSLLDKAAANGSQVAAYIRAEENRETSLAGNLAARNERIRNLVISASAGNNLARAELIEYKKSEVEEVLNTSVCPRMVDPRLNFRDIERIVSKDVKYEFGEPESLSEEHNIKVFRRLLTPLECTYLRAAAAPGMQASSTIHPVTGKFVKNSIRTSSSSNFDPTTRDCVIYAIDERLAAASGTDIDQGEPLNVLYYRVNEEYKYHYDHLPGDGREEITFLRQSGQRKYTFVISLNDGYSGGETHFPDLGLKYRGRIGDALMFQNIHDDGTVNKMMRHAGLPLAEGCKWVASKWIRQRKFDFGTPCRM